ncbi:MAG TPA: hypothetical protein VFA45_13400 [Actinomycetes bacterium]|jgi:hypothetical protein|nr:hypothetical protein [Actinomycetes bacterium]
MSGPKGGSYRIVSPEELRRRALAAARDRFDAAERALEGLRVEVASARKRHGRAISELTDLGKAPGAKASPEAVGAFAAQVEAVVREGRQRLRRQVAEARSQGVIASLAMASGPPVRSERQRPARSAPRSAPQAATTVAGRAPGAATSGATTGGTTSAIQEDVARQLGRLDAEASEADEAELKDLASATIAAASPQRARQLLDVLRQRVLDVNRRCDAARDRLKRLEELERLLDGLDGAPVVAARAALSGAWRDRKVDVEVVARQVETAARAAVSERDCRFVASASAACLRELGYEVQDGFETLIAHDGMAHLRRPDWPDHAVRLWLTPGTRKLRMHVVRRADGGSVAEADVAVEREWCASVDRWLAAMRDRGVAMEIQERTPPGALTVPAVSGRQFPFESQAPRPRPRERERHVD